MPSCSPRTIVPGSLDSLASGSPVAGVDDQSRTAAAHRLGRWRGEHEPRAEVRSWYVDWSPPFDSCAEVVCGDCRLRQRGVSGGDVHQDREGAVIAGGHDESRAQHGPLRRPQHRAIFRHRGEDDAILFHSRCQVRCLEIVEGEYPIPGRTRARRGAMVEEADRLPRCRARVSRPGGVCGRDRSDRYRQRAGERKPTSQSREERGEPPRRSAVASS